MLNAEEYKRYQTGRQRTFAMPKYLLRHWGYYEKNATTLTEKERSNAKRLYTALGYLTKEERLFLSKKYRVILEENRGHSQKHRLDKNLAKEYGMKQRHYAELRRGIELKFLHYLNKIIH